MSITATGHAEIDQQHGILESMVARLETFCPEADREANASCGNCSAARQQQCRTVLASLVSELRAFLAGHTTYEERMMELLPDSPTCQAHIKGHKAAHEGVAKQLRQLSTLIAHTQPRETSIQIWRIIGNWLGNHTALFDRRLVRLGRVAPPEFNFDAELVAMLDQHVFPNRPTLPKPSASAMLAQKKMKMEVRGRFESLTPAQRTVFWQVVGGKKNSEIAGLLGISINTVKTHRAAIFQKMDVVSVVELLKKTDALR